MYFAVFFALFSLLHGTPLTFSLNLVKQEPEFVAQSLRDQLFFISFPKRPSQEKEMLGLFVQLKSGFGPQECILPARIDFEVDSLGRLCFSKEASTLWMEVSSAEKGGVDVSVWALFESGEKKQIESFQMPLQKLPLSDLKNMPETSPFHKVAQIKWVGPDRLLRHLAKEAAPERLQGAGIEKAIELSMRQWLIYNGSFWEKASFLLPDETRPIARIEEAGASLIFQGWDGNSPIRFALNPPEPAPFRPKLEELFTSLRVRSDSQISCMLEKQCLILRTGDWVCKRMGRWKALRKKEEREAFQRGEIEGELFLFERIEMKQGQKMVRGTLFDASRTQAVPIELSAGSLKKKKERYAHAKS